MNTVIDNDIKSCEPLHEFWNKGGSNDIIPLSMTVFIRSIAVEELQESAGADILFKFVCPVDWGLHPDKEQSIVHVLDIHPDQDC